MRKFQFHAQHAFLFVIVFGATPFLAVKAYAVDDCFRWKAEIERINKEEIPAIQKSLREATDQLNSQKKNLTDAIKAVTAAEVAGVGISLANQNRDYWKKQVDETTRKVSNIRGREKYFKGEISRLENSIKENCSDGWKRLLGKWQRADGSLVFELEDMNAADREYYSDKPIKVEGRVRKVPPDWPDKIEVGDLLFISSEVKGNIASGKWTSVAQKGDCPKMPLDQSSIKLKTDGSGDQLIAEIDSKQYWYPKCEWSDKVKHEIITYYRVQ